MLSPEQISSFLREYAEAQASLTKARDGFISQALEHDKELVGCKDEGRRSFLLVSRFKRLLNAYDIEWLLGKVRTEQTWLQAVQQLKCHPQERLQWFTFYSSDDMTGNLKRRVEEVARYQKNIVHLVDLQKKSLEILKKYEMSGGQDMVTIETIQKNKLRLVTVPVELLLERMELARLEAADPNCVTLEQPRSRLTLAERIIRRIRGFIKPSIKSSGAVNLADSRVYKEKLQALKQAALKEVEKAGLAYDQQKNYSVYAVQFALKGLRLVTSTEGQIDHLILRQSVTHKFVSKDSHPVGIVVGALYEDEVYDVWLSAMRESEMSEAEWMKPSYASDEKDNISNLMRYIQLLKIYQKRDELVKAGQAAGFEIKKIQAN